MYKVKRYTPGDSRGVLWGVGVYFMVRSVVLVLISASVLGGVAYDVMSPVVQVLSPSGRPLGSATAVSPRKLVTNAHVAEKAKEVRLRIFRWDDAKRRIIGSFDVIAQIRAVDRGRDLALLELPRGVEVPFALLAPALPKLEIFTPVITVGAGNGQDVQPYRGEVVDQDASLPGGRPELQGLIQISSEVVGGCSGGAVMIRLRSGWRILGIVIGSFPGSEMSYCIPSTRAVEFLREVS